MYKEKVTVALREADYARYTYCETIYHKALVLHLAELVLLKLLWEKVPSVSPSTKLERLAAYSRGHDLTGLLCGWEYSSVVCTWSPNMYEAELHPQKSDAHL